MPQRSAKQIKPIKKPAAPKAKRPARRAGVGLSSGPKPKAGPGGRVARASVPKPAKARPLAKRRGVDASVRARRPAWHETVLARRDTLRKRLRAQPGATKPAAAPKPALPAQDTPQGTPASPSAPTQALPFLKRLGLFLGVIPFSEGRGGHS